MDVLEYDDPDEIEDIFCLDFTVEFSFLGQNLTFDLAEGGVDKEVTGDNREEYILAMCRFLLKTQVRWTMGNFVHGFHSVIPQQAVRMLSPFLLEGMLAGSSEVSDDDIGDLRNVVVVTNHDQQPDQPKLLNMFFETILAFDQDHRKKLLQFWCGTTRVPAAGFAQLHPPMTIAIL